MLLNGISLGLIILLAAYLMSQGVLTATLTLVSAAFASVISMGLFEHFMGPMAGWKPEYARGVTFLLLFFIALTVCRLLFDNLVPNNIILPKALDRSLGAVSGFFAGLIVVGTILLGVEMLPVGSTMLGFNRFPGKNLMEGSTPGIPATPASLWLSPDQFVTGMWGYTSGRSLGGGQSFTDVHPNMVVENYGYRYTIQLGQLHTINPKEGMNVDGMFFVKSDDRIASQLQPPAGTSSLIVRCVINQEDNVTDGDGYYRTTPSELRLVTADAHGKYHQYYPVGYMMKGKQFVATPLNTGQVLDDMNGGKAVEDWVFYIGSDEKPQLLEVKELARAELADMQIKAPYTVASAYPRKQYLLDVGSVTVTVTDSGKPLENVPVYLLRAHTTRREFSSLLTNAYDNFKKIRTNISNDTNGWKQTGAPGVADEGTFAGAQNLLQKDYDLGPSDEIIMSQAISPVLLAEETANGAQNPGILETFARQKLVPALAAIPSYTVEQGTTDAAGKVELPGIAKGDYILFAFVRTPTGFYAWIDGFSLAAKDKKVMTLEPGRATLKVAP